MFLIRALFLATALACGNASAAPNCRPLINEGPYVSANEDIGYSKTGVWVYWECINLAESTARGFPVYQMNVVFTRFDYGTKQSIGGKLDTALNSLVQFISSWKRNVTLSTTAPELAEIRAAFLEKHPECVGRF